MIPCDDRLLDLLGGLCNGSLSPAEERILAGLLGANDAARQLYVRYLDLHLALTDLDLLGGNPSDPLLIGGLLDEADLPAEPAGPLPRLDVGGGHWRGAAAYLSQTGPLSYMVATVIMCAMLLAAWAYTITHDYDAPFAQNCTYLKNSRGSTTPGLSTPQPSDPIFVARVTGMKDCRWSDPATETYGGAFVPLGRKYALASGLMEITYLSGAKVILEGPCSYEVESDAGGFLALGKLTAKVESRESRVESAKSPNLQISKSPNSKSSPLSPLPSPLFTVRTSTAIVTDLGTEFGVSVDANGDTTSHVFQGKVAVRAEGLVVSVHEGLAASAASDASQITLASGESARVERDAETGEARIATGDKAGVAPKFVRRIYEPPKVLDLLDIVAGGDGTGRRRERGINPTSGGTDRVFMARGRQGGGLYCLVGWNRFIDGVFIPDAGGVAVRLDSAGHTFSGFQHASAETYGSIWARGAKVNDDERSKGADMWIYSMGPGETFMPEGRGLLALHPNVGITFDLQAMRKMFPEVRPAQFTVTVGLADARNEKAYPYRTVELWVFVDGQVKGGRPAVVRHSRPPVSLDFEMGPEDQFLTLAAIDAVEGIAFDWLVLGDPKLHLSASPEEQKP